ncbi:hypothetical protein KA005_45160, partial [bacterium]|nr:hypothetical protein [bacterium]
MRKLLFIIFGWILLVLPNIQCVHQIEPRKKKIETIDDLPRYTYEVAGTLIELITSREVFEPFAAGARADIENVLETYEIEDKTTLRNFHGVLVSLDMLSDNFNGALVGIKRMRELEDKPAGKLMTGLINEAIIKVQREVGVKDELAYKEAFSRYLSQSVEKLPWDVVQERVEETKGRMELYSENVLLGMIQSQFEPAVKQTHQISNEVASQMIRIRFLKEIQLPLKKQIIEVLDKYINENRIVKLDIWKERNVELSEVENLQPVVVAIWDTGMDTEIFPGQLFVNTKEKLDGKDNDDNGFVDDVYGIAYTLENEKTPELLYPLEDAEERLPGMKEM